MFFEFYKKSVFGVKLSVRGVVFGFWEICTCFLEQSGDKYQDFLTPFLWIIFGCVQGHVRGLSRGQSAGWCREAEAARVASLRPLVLFLHIGRAEYELRLAIGEVLSTNAVELCHHAKNTIGQFRDTVE